MILIMLFAQTVFASSYSTTLRMSAGTYQYCSNNFRKFDGNSVTMSMTLRASECKYSKNSDCKLKASFYRKRFLGLGKSLISYRIYPVGYSSSTWQNVGADSYVWSFEKICGDARDRLYHAVYNSNNIVMKSK